MPLKYDLGQLQNHLKYLLPQLQKGLILSIVNLLSIGFSNALMDFFAILLGTSILFLIIFNPNAGRPRSPVTHKSSSIFAFDLSKTLFLFTSPKTVTLIDKGPLEVSPPISSTLNSLQHSKKPFENCFNQSLFGFWHRYGK